MRRALPRPDNAQGQMPGQEGIFSAGRFAEWYEALRTWFLTEVWTFDTVVQLPLLLLAAGLGYLAARLFARWLGKRTAEHPGEALRRMARLWDAVGIPLAILVLLWLSVGIAHEFGWSQGLARVVASLLTAWAVVRAIMIAVGETPWTRLIGLLVWLVAALGILGLLAPTAEFLDSLAITLGGLRLSVAGAVKGMIVLGILLWFAFAVSRLIEGRVRKSRELTPSIQVLIGKLAKIVLIVLAVLLALNSIGIDLTGLAVFGGAIGVGLGFGLQKIVSNLVSGVILLLDKSIKPGDVIEVGGTYGWINHLSARYVSVVTRDGTEHLIPNENLVVNPVINWSHSDNLVRQRVPVGIAYGSDVRKAIAVCLEAAREQSRVLAEPGPVCFIAGFGDSSVDLELRFWIGDPQNGVGNIKGAVLLAIWDKFHAHGIEIPFPQRDLHIRSAVPVRLARDDGP